MKRIHILSLLILILSLSMSSDAGISRPGLSTNVPSTIVRRDSSGNFSAGVMTGSASLNVLKSGDTMSGTLNMGTNSITNVVDPTAAQSAATKNYVDTQLSYLNPADRVQAASTVNIAGTYLNVVGGVCIGDTFTTTSTATFSVDGYTASVGDRILFKNQTFSFQDGVWTLTTLAVPAVSGAVFTRALDFDTTADFNSGQIIPVVNGTQAGSSWYQTANITTCSSDSQTWTKFQNAASAYLLVANNLSDVNSTLTSFNNISGMSTLGDTIYGGAAGTRSILSGNTTSTKKFLSQTGTGAASAAPSWLQPACGDLSNAASSCSTDTTNASNITSGTLPKAQLGNAVTSISKNGSAALTGDVTLFAGSNVTLTQSSQAITIAATGGGSGSVTLSVVTKTSSYTVSASDDVILANGATQGFYVNLPAATNSGKVYYVKKIDVTNNPITVTPNGSDTIDGDTSQLIDIPYMNVIFLDGGNNKWHLL